MAVAACDGFDGSRRCLSFAGARSQLQRRSGARREAGPVARRPPPPGGICAPTAPAAAPQGRPPLPAPSGRGSSTQAPAGHPLPAAAGPVVRAPMPTALHGPPPAPSAGGQRRWPGRQAAATSKIKLHACPGPMAWARSPPGRGAGRRMTSPDTGWRPHARLPSSTKCTVDRHVRGT
jgi:hypothetical protein